MNLLRRNINIAFSLAAPERAIEQIRCLYQLRQRNHDQLLNSREMGKEYYYSLSRMLDKDYSYEENLCMYDQMNHQIKAYKRVPESLFQLLIGFSEESLRIEGCMPVCKKDRALSWRSLTLTHGQDLFTCSFLAYLTLIGTVPLQSRFDWSAIIETDDKRLKSLLRRGIAENHFHLVGSTRVFTLSWIALMNNPEKINHFFNRQFVDRDVFTANRSSKVSFDNNEVVMSWNDKLIYAAWIRAKLFQLVYGSSEESILEQFYEFELKLEKSSELISEIRTLQYQYGRLFKLPSGVATSPDYAICDTGSPVDKTSPDRLLCGERELMYRLFLRVYRGQLKDCEQDLFYAYLLLKNCFRSEMIQINQEVGFANFSMYQDRKDTFWEDIPVYWYEAQRLAVNSTFKSGAVRSLEMRVQPKKTYQDNYDLLMEEDQIILFNDDKRKFIAPGSENSFHNRDSSWTLFDLSEAERMKKCADMPFFYVMHFIKKKNKLPASHMPFNLIQPRCSEARFNARIRALALAVTLYRSNYLCTRIRGIDAASFEIGCRPETFATEFRFLTKYVPDKTAASKMIENGNVMPKLGVTYHAGEDFLDVTDGLRAIDEAIRFLHLKRGDRIGHALALGVDPKDHYLRKRHHVTTTKQDMLDNYVWILNKGLELGVAFDYSLEIGIRNEAERLLSEIYGKCIKRHGWHISLEDYYDSWKLRGDNPLCYSSMSFKHPYQDTISFMYQNTISYKYYNSFKDDDDCDIYRSRDSICGLVFYYHYGYEERKKGMETCSKKITPEHIELVRKIQDGLQRVISEKGIIIECNLSSNQLIGTFGRYDKHPVFRFNGYFLCPDSNSYNIPVSLNTDDQGVFDTSLENEYALIADSMSKMRDENNNRKYSDDIIYDYLDQIRRMGIEHTFTF